jgi:periplasmic protein TonB
MNVARALPMNAFSVNGIAAAARSPAVPAMGLAVIVSLGLFWLMFEFMGNDGHAAGAIETLPSIDFVRLRRDTQTETLQRRKPPPPPEPPPPVQRMHIATEAAQSTAAPAPMAIPNLGISTSVGGGPFIGELGGAGAPDMSGLFDGDIIPLQRIAPQYPRDAARARINGWVQLEVLVNADGSVRSAKVTEAQPKGLFEANAVAAVLRWRFKPKVVNGTPVAQRGSQRIEFNIRGE